MVAYERFNCNLFQARDVLCSKTVFDGACVITNVVNIYYFLNILLLLVSTDVQQNPGPTSWSNALRKSSFNARSIVNRHLDLQAYVTLVNPDFIAITETWLDNNIDDNELLPNCYNIYRKDRESRGGGVLLAVKSNISCFRRRDLEESDCELLWGEVPFKDSSWYFVRVFYCPPSSDLTYLEELAKSLDKVSLISEHANILLLGNFNLPDIDWDLISPLQPNSLSDYFCDNILNFFSLSQLITVISGRLPARQITRSGLFLS